jgi:hypothetical protein
VGNGGGVLERYAAERLIDLGTAPVAEPADIRQQQRALRGAEQVKRPRE